MWIPLLHQVFFTDFYETFPVTITISPIVPRVSDLFLDGLMLIYNQMTSFTLIEIGILFFGESWNLTN